MRKQSAEAREVTLLELVDRLIDRGVVLTGDITIAVADVDLITLGLRLALASTERLRQASAASGLALVDAVASGGEAERAKSGDSAERAETTDG